MKLSILVGLFAMNQNALVWALKNFYAPQFALKVVFARMAFSEILLENAFR
jgi:hypothetical protein